MSVSHHPVATHDTTAVTASVTVGSDMWDCGVWESGLCLKIKQKGITAYILLDLSLWLKAADDEFV